MVTDRHDESAQAVLPLRSYRSCLQHHLQGMPHVSESPLPSSSLPL